MQLHFLDPNISAPRSRKPPLNFHIFRQQTGSRGGAVVEALRYKSEGRGIDSRLYYWNFSLT
jgi:hypothetical protein